EAYPDILDRVAGHHALLHRLVHALLDRGDEAGRDHPALDGVYELEPGPDLQRLDLDAAVAKLPSAAGLLLVAAVGLGRAPDRLLVGHARRLEGDLRAEPRAQTLHDHLDVDLRQAGHDLLAGLRIAMQ